MKIKKVYEKSDYNNNNKSKTTSIICAVYLFGGIVEYIISFDTLELAYEYKLNWINNFIDSYDKDKYPTKKDVLDDFYNYYVFQIPREKLNDIVTFDEELYKPIFFDLEIADEWYWDNNEDEELKIEEIKKQYTEVDIPDIVKIHRNTNKYNL